MRFWVTKMKCRKLWKIFRVKSGRSFVIKVDGPLGYLNFLESLISARLNFNNYFFFWKIIVIVQNSRKHPGWSPNLLLNFWPAHLIWHSANVISLVRSPCSLTFCRNVRARGGPKLAQCQDLVLFIPFRRSLLRWPLTYRRTRVGWHILLDRFIDFTFSPRF